MLTYPLALLGLATVPALFAIYFFRQRHKRLPVSSLMLWRNVAAPPGGGDRLRRLETPLLFFLELLALLLAVLAAVDPQVYAAASARPLIVVLDDSFSMRAGGDDSARHRAATALAEELQRRPRPSIRLLLAGDRPTTLGEPVRSAAEVAQLLNGWTCHAPTARLSEAIALAGEIGGDWSLILVLTDHAPAVEPEGGRVAWWSFGAPRTNRAIVNAARTLREDADRCLLEVANLADTAGRSTLVLEAGEPPAVVHRADLDLAAGETRRLVLSLPAGTTALQARIGPDDLDGDNAVTLLPSPARTARVSVEIEAEPMRGPVERALKAVRNAVVTGTRPDLIVTDRDEIGDPTIAAWRVRLLAERDASAYLGPFVLDRSHPLAEGLSLQGVIWGGGKTDDLPGAPVVLAGNVPLVTDSGGDVRREIRLRWRSDLSTLQDGPAWPALIWNLVQWRAAELPGLQRANYRLGEDAILTLSAPRESVRVTAPDETTRTVASQGRRVTIPAEAAGLYTVDVGEGAESFAVNPLARDESDLRQSVAGRWGDWLDDATQRPEYRSTAWLWLLAALALLTVHLALSARGRTGP